MRIFLSVLILIFGLQSWTKADNIKDFEIEGMSVGDSLLNYYSDNKIQDNKMNYLEGKRNFYVVGMDDGSNLYDNIEFYLKTGDKKFLIYGISAGIFYRDNYNQCEKKKDKIGMHCALRTVHSTHALDGGTALVVGAESPRIQLQLQLGPKVCA